MDCSTPGFPVCHQLPELAQTQVHRVVMPSNYLILWRSLLLQSFPASGSFPRSQFFASGGQNIGVSASASVLPMTVQDWFPLGWTGWMPLQSKGLSRVFSNTTVQKHQFFFIAQLSHPYMTTRKTIALTRQTFVGKVISVIKYQMLPFFGVFSRSITLQLLLKLKT